MLERKVSSKKKAHSIPLQRTHCEIPQSRLLPQRALNLQNFNCLRKQQKSHGGLWIFQQPKFCLLEKTGYLLWYRWTRMHRPLGSCDGDTPRREQGTGLSQALFPQALQGVAGCQHFHTSPAFSCMLAKALIFSGVELSPEALRMVKD